MEFGQANTFSPGQRPGLVVATVATAKQSKKKSGSVSRVLYTACYGGRRPFI